MNPQIAAAKAAFERASGRLLTVFGATPDDKLNWSPSPTARTPLQLAVHCGQGMGFIQRSLEGAQAPSMTTEQFDASFREAESKYTTRDEAVNLIEQNSAAYIAWLEGLGDEQVSGIWHSPFGDVPMAMGIMVPTYHTANHTAQIEYIQTIYGDRTWR